MANTNGAGADDSITLRVKLTGEDALLFRKVMDETTEAGSSPTAARDGPNLHALQHLLRRERRSRQKRVKSQHDLGFGPSRGDLFWRDLSVIAWSFCPVKGVVFGHIFVLLKLTLYTQRYSEMSESKCTLWPKLGDS